MKVTKLLQLEMLLNAMTNHKFNLKHISHSTISTNVNLFGT